MPKFYFPCSYIVPEFDQDEIGISEYTILKRKVNTTIFDLMVILTKHKTALSYQLIDIMLSQCNLEIVIEANDIDSAKSKFNIIKVMLYLEHLSPFINAFVSNYSVNEYSGINEREDNHLRTKLQESELQKICSRKGTVQIWANELCLLSIGHPEKRKINFEVWNTAVKNAKKWEKLIKDCPSLIIGQGALIAAPQISSIDSAFLHIWLGIESLFPTIDKELSFRIGLFISQLVPIKDDRMGFYKVIKSSYNKRSKVAHGEIGSVKEKDWMEGWTILIMALRAVIWRGSLPNEEELFQELLK